MIFKFEGKHNIILTRYIFPGKNTPKFWALAVCSFPGQAYEKLVFWPRLPTKSGLGNSMARKAELLWPHLLGYGQASQTLPGHIFLVSLT